MACFVKSCVSVHARRFTYNLIGDMNRSHLAYLLLATLSLFVIYTGLNCAKVTEPSIQENYQRTPKDQSSLMMASEAELPSGKVCSKKFSVTNMSVMFDKCANNDEIKNVNMDCYLEAWGELIKFLNSMGKGFSFIASDVVEKCEHLRNLKSKVTKEYETVNSMVLYEMENNLIQYKSKPQKPVLSGSRTLLRLHRALIFLKMFFDKICDTEDDNAKVSQMCYDAYHASPMSKYHSWLIRKAVGVAVIVLPNRKTFATQLCQTDLTHEEIYEKLRECSKNMNQIYESTEKIYQRNKLMELP